MAARPARACSVCAGGDPTLNRMGAELGFAETELCSDGDAELRAR